VNMLNILLMIVAWYCPSLLACWAGDHFLKMGFGRRAYVVALLGPGNVVAFIVFTIAKL
jgi:hypothetical protein